jgi:prolyl oligopeptidase
LAPSYSAFLLAWVQAGGVFALAHLRNGVLDGKRRVVEDFVAAAEGVVAAGWTVPGRLAACGESNGGLIVGAAVTARPELFSAVVCSAPLLDMVRYERSGMGAAWVGEYGSVGDRAGLEGLLGVSPYHRVRGAVAYPAVLFTVFEGDTRVDPMHARKMCAALQWATSGSGPVVLREEAGVGHGARSASRGVALAADMLAFVAAQTGLTP